MADHICKQEHVLGSHTEQLKTAGKERGDLMNAIKELVQETKKITMSSVNADHVLSESFVEIKTLLSVQADTSLAYIEKQKAQDELLHKIDSNIRVMRNDVNNISEDITKHKENSMSWRDAIEARLKKLENIRIFIYAFCLILVIVAALIVRVSDTWTAIDRLKDKSTKLDEQMIELEEERDVLPKVPEPVEPIKLIK